MAKKQGKVSADIELPDASNMPVVLGTYEGECADASITNKNGLDITRPVWEKVFASEDYKQAIELGWYIGYLGHPEDPNCMDFRNACIVMRSGRIGDNDKIYGKFDLIDTPVGRVVKAFQDAGVVFGISVRGAGDIIDNSVDPETFTFRGFDLVTFPAYPDAIPTFTKIAASTDRDSQQKYKKVCAAIKANLPQIASSSSLDIIQSQLAAQSDEYKAIEARKNQLCESEEENVPIEDITDEKVEAMTNLYLEQVEANHQLQLEMERQAVTASKKLNRIKAIMSSQLKMLQKQLDSAKNHQLTSVAANRRLKEENISLQQANLKYNQDIKSGRQITQKKDSELHTLQDRLDETFASLTSERKKTSNLGEEVKKLQSRLTATTKLLSNFQHSYAQLYASAVGVDVGKLPIQASTSVVDIRQMLGGTTSVQRAAISTTVEGDISTDVDDDPNTIISL